MRDGERVDREQAQRGLAVDEDVVVLLQDRSQHPGQGHLAGDLGDQLDLGRGQVDVGRQQVQARDVRLDPDVLDGHVGVHQDVVDRQVEVVRVDAEADRQGTLRVEVDEQHPAPVFGEGRAQVDGRRGLAHAALLVGHRDDPRRAVPVHRHRLGDRLAHRVGRRVGRSELRTEVKRCLLGAHRGGPRLRLVRHARHRNSSPLPAAHLHPGPIRRRRSGEAGRPLPDSTSMQGTYPTPRARRVASAIVGYGHRRVGTRRRARRQVPPR